jgi:molybdenum cofactor guanylyltransferase
MNLVVGVFVGGRSVRMGGAPKGLLTAPDTGEALVTRTLRLARALPAEAVLVGEASAYGHLAPDTVIVADDPPGIGPLGGLHALFTYAGERSVIALACDMPHVSIESLRALAAFAPDAHCVAAQNADRTRWEPFFARYDGPRARAVAAAMIGRGERSLQKLVEGLEARAIEVDATTVIDWDTPEDVALTRCRTP